MRFFNTTGPCNSQRHYMLSPEKRLPNLERYLQQELYFGIRKWWRVQEQAVYAHGNKNYPEALPHLTFMAFLQRVVNGGGQILREFAAGREAIDLVVEYASERHILELKRVKDRSVEAVVADGVPQLCGYLDTVGEKTGWLIVFDQRKTVSWEERLWREDRVVAEKTLFLRGA